MKIEADTRIPVVILSTLFHEILALFSSRASFLTSKNEISCLAKTFIRICNYNITNQN